MKTINIKNTKSFCAPIMLVCFSSATFAFELMSEGAMGSVSVVSGPLVASALESTDSNDEYESLPFTKLVTVSKTDKVSDDLDFDLTKEVEDWAKTVRENVNALFEVSTIDALPNSEPYDIPFKEEHHGVELIDAMGDLTGRVIYQRGSHSHSTRTSDASLNSITVEHTAYTERAATIDANPYVDGSSYGSTYLTDIRASAWHRTTQRD